MASNSTDQGSPNGGGRKFDGMKSVAELLNFMAPENRQRLLSNLAKADPSLTEKIKGKMLGFDEVFQLEDSQIKILLSKVPMDQLKLALKGASEELLGKIFSNMSVRAAPLLKEELSSQGPQRQSKITSAQVEIVELAKQIFSEKK